MSVPKFEFAHIADALKKVGAEYEEMAAMRKSPITTGEAFEWVAKRGYSVSLSKGVAFDSSMSRNIEYSPSVIDFKLNFDDAVTLAQDAKTTLRISIGVTQKSLYVVAFEVDTPDYANFQMGRPSTLRDFHWDEAFEASILDAFSVGVPMHKKHVEEVAAIQRVLAQHATA